jgi:hypothetical protein
MLINEVYGADAGTLRMSGIAGAVRGRMPPQILPGP